MKLVVFSPYGEHAAGQGTISMLLRYLHSYCVDIHQLHCNGAFSLCDRDLSSAGGRTIEHCLKCSSEQREEANFTGANIHKITDELTVEDLEKTRRRVLETEAESLWDEQWYGLALSETVGASFQKMSGDSEPRWQSQKHVALIKRLALVAMRLQIASQRMFNRIQPDWIWLPAGDDILTVTAAHIARNTPAATLQFQVAADLQVIFAYRTASAAKVNRAVGNRAAGKVIKSSEESSRVAKIDSHPYRLPSIVETVKEVREDIESWPKEVISEFDDFLGYLGIGVRQLGLPVAR